MSRIAFDCSGTLIRGGSNIEAAVKLIKWLQSKGHEVVIWSNAWNYTQEAKKKHGLSCECDMKRCTWDYDNEDDYFDIAIDDDMSQTYLATKLLLNVCDIPNDESLFEEKYGELLKS